MFFLILLSLLGFSFCLVRFCRWKPEASLLFVVAAITTILYLAALLSILQTIAFILFVFGCLSFLTLLLVERLRLVGQLSQYLSPGIVFFTGLSIFLWFKLSGAHFTTLDEFAHWALASKNIYLTHALVKSSSAIVFQDYPPAASLFHYYAYQLLGFSAQTSFFAQDILILAPLTVLFQNLRWRQDVFRIFLTVILAYSIIYLFGHWSYNRYTGGQGELASLYVDTVLSAFTAAAFVLYYQSRGHRVFLLQLIPVLFCLPLIKSAGTFFAMLIVFTIFLDQLCQRVWVDHTRSYRLVFLSLLGLLLVVLVSYASWRTYVNVNHLKHRFPDVTLTSMEKHIDSSQETLSLRRFGAALLSHQVGRAGVATQAGAYQNFSLLFWLPFILILSLLAFKVQKSSRFKVSIATMSIGLLIGFVVYCAGLFLMYLNLFSAFERDYLASLPRYLGIYFLPWCVLLYSFFITSLDVKVSKKLYLLLISLLPIVCVLLAPPVAANFLLKPLPRQSFKMEIWTMMGNIIKNKTHPHDSIYIVWQQHSRDVLFGQKYLAYTLFPRRVNTQCWTLMPVKAIHACRLSKKAFYGRLKHYDYILLVKTDAYFRKTYASLFNNPKKVFSRNVPLISTKQLRDPN